MTNGVCGRTEQVRNAIVAAVADASDCATVTATQLGQIATLDLFGRDITALQADDFAGLSGLTTLKHAGVERAAGGTPAWRLGGRLSIDPGLSLSLEGSRGEDAGKAPEHRLELRGTLRY